MKSIKISADFSNNPGARYISDGDYSGELFRKQYLEKIFEDLNATDKFLIDLDGANGYATSFLEEAFGGLARIFGKKRVLDRIQFKSDEDPSLIDEIKEYINDVEKDN